MDESTTQETRERRREQLKTLRDEIRVKLHLAGMEVKDEWKKIEPEVDHVMFRVESATERALDVLIKKLQKFNDSLNG